MARTTTKGKGPGKAKGRKRDTSKESNRDGGSGSDIEESLRQKILETEGRTLSDTVPAGRMRMQMLMGTETMLWMTMW